MRNGFITRLIDAARQNDRIMLLNGDLGFSVIENFTAAFPDRSINAGIAEQSMVGIAAGLAQSGRKVFTYSIANFAVTRCLEQIRNDVCYHNVDVTIVAVGGGLPYGSQGYTHFGVEDVAFTRVLPNMKVYVPADKPEMEWCVGEILTRGGPAYLRLARGGEPDLHKAVPQGNGLFEVKSGTGTAFITQGTILGEAMAAAEGTDAAVYSLPAMNADTAKTLEELARTFKTLITVEEHVLQGGMGSFVAEILAGMDAHAKHIRRGVTQETLSVIGDQAYLRAHAGIDRTSLKSLLK